MSLKDVTKVVALAGSNRSSGMDADLKISAPKTTWSADKKSEKNAGNLLAELSNNDINWIYIYI